jgi:hypothetical protein
MKYGSERMGETVALHRVGYSCGGADNELKDLYKGYAEAYAPGQNSVNLMLVLRPRSDQ